MLMKQIDRLFQDGYLFCLNRVAESFLELNLCGLQPPLRLEGSEAPVPWPAEEQEDKNPQLCPSEEKATRSLSRSRRRQARCRVQDKGRRHYICRFIRFVSALLVWVRRRHPARRNRRSDACYVAIRKRRGCCRYQKATKG
ncbi:hypothetical protein Taro_054332 [Colocasia esculenta]|uniref:Uncharacterized protein n=1 Tax=Colocasia esculenta TaxID=4460 RepID=A0A843XQ50_COLES|nr:hypothetical protein [Colocasia esculenta]